ncbi:MAG: hypothetical protein R6V60_01770 [Desulfobacterales bacterium]
MLAACWAAAALAGCIIVPIPTKEGKVLSGKPVAEEQLAFLPPESSTKRDVLERLGSPTVIWEDARVFVYSWEIRQAIVAWAVGGYGRAAAGLSEVPKHYLVLIQFDETDHVRRIDRTVCPMSRTYSDFLKDWVRTPDTHQPPGKQGPVEQPR